MSDERHLILSSLVSVFPCLVEEGAHVVELLHFAERGVNSFLLEFLESCLKAVLCEHDSHQIGFCLENVLHDSLFALR